MIRVRGYGQGEGGGPGSGIAIARGRLWDLEQQRRQVSILRERHGAQASAGHHVGHRLMTATSEWPQQNHSHVHTDTKTI